MSDTNPMGWSIINNPGLAPNYLREANSQISNSSQLALPYLGNSANDFSNQFGMSTSDISNALKGSTPTQASGNWFSNLFSHKDPMTGEMSPDYMGTGLNLLQSGLGFYLGSQQLKQAEDALSESRRQFNLNYNAQKSLINNQLAWQYQARKDRNAANAGTLTQIS